MKFKLLTVSLLLGVFLISTSFNHALKLTTSLIEYDSEKNSIRMECRLFIDDFENTIDRDDFNVSSLSNEDIQEIEYYFDKFYRILINSNKLKLNYESSKVYGTTNVLGIKFLIEDISIEEGDALLIENKLFFAEFGPLQSNQMTVRIPPFLNQGFHETTLDDYVVNYQF